MGLVGRWTLPELSVSAQVVGNRRCNLQGHFNLIKSTIPSLAIAYIYFSIFDRVNPCQFFSAICLPDTDEDFFLLCASLTSQNGRGNLSRVWEIPFSCHRNTCPPLEDFPPIPVLVTVQNRKSLYGCRTETCFKTGKVGIYKLLVHCNV